MKRIMLLAVCGLLVLYLATGIPGLWAVPEPPEENGGPGNSPISFVNMGSSSESIDCGGHVAFHNQDLANQSVLVRLKDDCDQLDSEIECRRVKDDPESVTSRQIIGDGKTGSHICDLPPGGAAFVVCNGFDGGCELLVTHLPFIPFFDDDD